VFNSEVEPDAVFSQEQWADIAKSIGVSDLPIDMKQEISNILFQNFLSNAPRAATHRRALKRLAEVTANFRTRLTKIQGQLTKQTIINEVETLIDRAYAVQKIASRDLKAIPKSKGGAPPKINRDSLVENLLRIYAKHTGMQTKR
jgi:hypothetical protein